jgi:hypothetical protein
MSDLRTDPSNALSSSRTAEQNSPMFGHRPERSGFPPAIWGAAALIVIFIIGALILVGRHQAAPPPNRLLPADPYAASLPVSHLAMSESESVSGVKVTYLDGRIQNTGSKTVTSVTAQVVFANDENMPAQIETVPLTLIRTHEPYVDTQPVSANPLHPGDDREFRLIFESIPENWNTQMPLVRIIQVGTR